MPVGIGRRGTAAGEARVWQAWPHANRPWRTNTAQAPLFFVPRDSSPDTARMDKPAKVVHNNLRELLGGQVRSVLEQGPHIGHNVGREFVGVFGATLVGHQPRESCVCAGRARLGAYRTRAAKGGRGLRHSPAVERHMPEHCGAAL